MHRARGRARQRALGRALAGPVEPIKKGGLKAAFFGGEVIRAFRSRLHALAAKDSLRNGFRQSEAAGLTARCARRLSGGYRRGRPRHRRAAVRLRRHRDESSSAAPAALKGCATFRARTMTIS